MKHRFPKTIFGNLNQSNLSLKSRINKIKFLLSIYFKINEEKNKPFQFLIIKFFNQISYF